MFLFEVSPICKEYFPEALRIGLAHEAWPVVELKNRAIDLARELAAQPAQAVRSMLELIVGSEDKTLAELLVSEQQAVQENQGTKDAHEGIMAFLEKREPLFSQ